MIFNGVQSEAVTRDRLLAAVYERRPRAAERAAEELCGLLGEAALFDPDLAIAQGWLAEEHALEAQRRARTRQHSLKWILTGAPLLLATFLTALLAAVLFWSV